MAGMDMAGVAVGRGAGKKNLMSCGMTANGMAVKNVDMFVSSA